jgi:RNA polymerase sigma factor (TIGR02999 family)
MRRVLVDHARGRNRVKRGGGWARIHLEDAPLAVGGREVDFVEIHEAIEKLSAANERQGRIVELRFFSGLTVEEVSEVLGLSARAVEKEWRLARAWLYRLLHEERSP